MRPIRCEQRRFVPRIYLSANTGRGIVTFASVARNAIVRRADDRSSSPLRSSGRVDAGCRPRRWSVRGSGERRCRRRPAAPDHPAPYRACLYPPRGGWTPHLPVRCGPHEARQCTPMQFPHPRRWHKPRALGDAPRGRVLRFDQEFEPHDAARRERPVRDQGERRHRQAMPARRGGGANSRNERARGGVHRARGHRNRAHGRSRHRRRRKGAPHPPRPAPPAGRSRPARPRRCRVPGPW